MPRFLEKKGIVTKINFLNLMNSDAKFISYATSYLSSSSENLDFNAIIIIKCFNVAIMSHTSGVFHLPLP